MSFYVTTPIYYINDVPHLGSAYTTVVADALARYHRVRGERTRFLTGTDEHGLKIQRVADERGTAPQAFADEVSAIFEQTWPRLGCAPDDFIRTSSARHQAGVHELWKRIFDAGDLVLGHYEGLYCVQCEGYYTAKDLDEGNCPLHKKPVETVKEESYFFRLSRYGERLLDFYRDHPDFVQPAGRFNEVKSFVAAGLEDLSVSRTTFKWGIPVPGDERHVLWVWMDALSNYYTALRRPEDLSAELWPSAVHLVGKDILRFHAIYWPAFLMAAGLPPPKQVWAHGFLTYGGHKMSKTLRNTVSPVALAEAVHPLFGADVVRYVLMRAISFGQDGDFSVDDLLQRYASELGNTLGNLLNRVLPFADAVPDAPDTDDGDLERELKGRWAQGAATVKQAWDDLEPTGALTALWALLQRANEYVDRAAPWAAKKQGDTRRLATIVRTLLELLSGVSVMLSPVMPAVADAMRAQLGLAPLTPEVGLDAWPHAWPTRTPGEPLTKGAPLFPRMEPEQLADVRRRFAPPSEAAVAQTAQAAPPAPPAAPTKSPWEADPAKPAVAFDDFAKVDLRAGLVLAAKRVPKKDKLLELSVDLGEAAPRTIVAGIAQSYAPEELVGRRVAVLANLAPRDFGKGLVSHGMLLAAEGAGKLLLPSLDERVAPGAALR
jgi:methionyl-tRNA synthetase